MGNIQSLSVETGVLANIFEFLDDFVATTNDFDPTFLQNYHKDFYAMVSVSKWAKTQIVLYLTKIRKLNICHFDYTEKEIFVGLLLKETKIPIPEMLVKLTNFTKRSFILFLLLEIFSEEETKHPKFFDVPFGDVFVIMCHMIGEWTNWQKESYRMDFDAMATKMVFMSNENKFEKTCELFLKLHCVNVLALFSIATNSDRTTTTVAKYIEVELLRLRPVVELSKKAHIMYFKNKNADKKVQTL